MKVSSLTGTDNYFEDFAVGEVLRHRRGKTIEPTENVVITNMVMNSASSHFDDLVMKDTIFKKRLQFGGVTASLIVGMASQDTSENSLAELGMTNIRFKVPVFHGDTLYAYTEVLAKTEVGRSDAGEVLFHHWGVNQDDKVVFEGDRRVLVKKRAHWGTR
jgi:itaconyl-CoA hydratase